MLQHNDEDFHGSHSLQVGLTVPSYVEHKLNEIQDVLDVCIHCTFFFD